MCDDVVINCRKKGEFYPGLAFRIHEVKKKFGIEGILRVYIVNDFKDGPNLLVKLEEPKECKCKSIKKKSAGILPYNLLISRGVLKKLDVQNDTDELMSFIAHEMSHIFYNDPMVKTRIFLIYIIPLILYLVVEMGGLLFGKVLPVTDPRLIILFCMIAGVLIIVGIRNANYASRSMETRADSDAVFVIQKPEAFQRAIKKLFIDFDSDKESANKIWRNAFGRLFYFLVGYEHPSNFDRIKNIEALKHL